MTFRNDGQDFYPPLRLRPEVIFEGVHATLIVRRPARGVVVLVISGRDGGEHGDDPFQELAHDLAHEPFTLFVDARATQGASLDVSNVWAQWLRTHRDRFHRIIMLTGSPFVQLTADFVRRFADLGDAMHLTTEPAAFDQALREATRPRPLRL